MKLRLAQRRAAIIGAGSVLLLVGGGASAADDVAALRAEHDKRYAAALARLADLSEKYGLTQRAKYTRGWHVRRDAQKIYVFDHLQKFVPDALATAKTKPQEIWLSEFKRIRRAQATLNRNALRPSAGDR